MSSTTVYVAKSFAWGTISKLFDAVIKFISVSLLLTYFGKEDFGLITLAISVNAYLQLLDLGVNLGSIKHFSEWIGAKKYDLVDQVARTSMTFYGAVGILNAFLLVLVSFWGIDLFHLKSDQALIMQNLLFVLAFIATINWMASVFNQLLIANENIAYVHRINIIRTLANLVVIVGTIHYKLEIIDYFIWFTLVNSLQIIPFYLKSKKDGLITSIKPSNDWKHFRIILKYSLAIMAMGIFQMTATKMRPIVLSAFSDQGVGIVAEYRIIETITLFVISIGGMFISIFLPKTSKLLLKKNHAKVEQFAYQATLYTTIVCLVLCVPFIINAKEILTLYVGNEYIYLSKWLIFWLITILCYLHNSPVSSLVLSTGKTKMLVYSSAISCVISLVINAIYCKQYGVGSAIIGYGVYIAIQMSFYYFYFNKNILNLNSWLVFKSFFIPFVLGALSCVLILLFNIHFQNSLLNIILRSILWFVLFAIFIFATKTISLKQVIIFLKTKMI